MEGAKEATNTPASLHAGGNEGGFMIIHETPLTLPKKPSHAFFATIRFHLTPSSGRRRTPPAVITLP